MDCIPLHKITQETSGTYEVYISHSMFGLNNAGKAALSLPRFYNFIFKLYK